jgi:hypothetical protein
MHVRTIVQVDGNVNVLYDYAGLVWFGLGCGRNVDRGKQLLVCE